MTPVTRPDRLETPPGGLGAGRAAVTLREVAALANVSIATASNALSGTRSVSAASVERVLRAAAELGYRRNEVARSLRTGLHNAIGLVVPDVTNPFWGGMVGVIERLASDAGFQVALRSTGFDPAREADALTRLMGSVDGILLVSTGPDAATVQPLIDAGVPVVACDEAFEVDGIGGVYSDNVGGARAAAHHLVDAGGRIFGILEGPPSLPTAVQRSAGFRAGLAERGIEASRLHRVVVRYSFEGGRDGIRALFELEPEIDAVFACTDNQAIGAIFDTHDLGRSVPEDLLVCGFDDISWSSRITPTLTTVRQDATGMAEVALDMLIEMITFGAAPRVTTFPVELVGRESTRRAGGA